jgi:hypothetical protein
VTADPAQRYVDDARRLLGESNPDAQKRVAAALSKHFAASGPNAVTVGKQIDATLKKMSEKLGEIQTPENVSREVNCHAASESVCQIADAYIDRTTEIPKFNLCPGFSTGARDNPDRPAEI